MHNLEDLNGNQTEKGTNPFGHLALSNIVKVYDPPYSVSTTVYSQIRNNLDDWVEEAIRIRNNY